MKKMYVAWLVLGLATVVSFQNCSSSMPNLSDNTTSSVEPVYAQLQLFASNPSPAASETQLIYATGGKLPYVYSVTSGGCTVDPNSGSLTVVATAGTTCGLLVTDARGLTAVSAVTVASAATVQPVVDPVTPNNTVFDVLGTQTFIVPAYNNLIVEVWGGGGAGGTYNGATGASGGSSSVNGTAVSVSATGGSGGVGYTMSGNLISGGMSFNQGRGGAAGSGITASGGAGSLFGGGTGGGPGGGAGAVNQPGYGAPAAAPGTPGGGGGGYCANVNSGGGGGGGYSTQTFAISGGGPAKNTQLTIVVGAGGASAAGATISGAQGRVKITWN